MWTDVTWTWSDYQENQWPFPSHPQACWGDWWHYGSYNDNTWNGPRSRRSRRSRRKQPKDVPHPPDEPMSIPLRLTNNDWTGAANDDGLAAAEQEAEAALSAAEDRWIVIILSWAAKQALMALASSLMKRRPMATEQQMTAMATEQQMKAMAGNLRILEKKYFEEKLQTTLRTLRTRATWEQDVELCMVVLYKVVEQIPFARYQRRILRDAYVWRTCANLGFNDRITIVSQFNADFADIMTNDLRAQLLLAYASLANACPRQDSFDSKVKERRGGRPPRRRRHRCYAHYPTNLCISTYCIAYRRTALHIVDGIAYLRSELQVQFLCREREREVPEVLPIGGAQHQLTA